MSDPQVNGLEFFESAMTEMGIDKARLDEDSLEFSEEPKVESAEPAKPQNESEVSDLEDEAASENPESVEQESEVPNEEVAAQDAKANQEIEQAKQELEAQKIALMEEVQTKQKELEEFKSQATEQLREYDEFSEFLKFYAEKDPDMFGLLEQEFKDFHKQTYSNPVVNQLSKHVEELKKELGSFKEKASDEVTLTKLSSEINQVKSTLGKEAEASGIKIDWNKAEEIWAANPKLSFEEAVWAKYGNQLAKAQASKAKVATAQNIVKARPAVSTSGTVKKSNTPVAKDYSRMSYLDILKEEARALRA